MMSKIRPFLIVLAITILSYLSVGIVYRVLSAHTERGSGKEKIAMGKTHSPSVAMKQPLAFYTPIEERNLFGTTGAIMLKDRIDIEELEPTTLRLRLLGTVAGSEGFDYAIIEETGSREQELLRLGDTVASATIVKIMRGMVVLRANGKDTMLRMEEKAGGGGQGIGEGTPPQEDHTVTVSKAEIDEAMSNMSQFLTQAKIHPFFSAGGTANGFIISRIQKGSIFQKMGMQNGDIIQNVNGQPIQSPTQMMDLYKDLQSGSGITLHIKRRGKEQDLKYVFE